MYSKGDDNEPSAWQEEEELINASRKSSPVYSSDSDSTDDTDTDTEEVETYTVTRQKKTTSKLNLSQIGIVSGSDGDRVPSPLISPTAASVSARNPEQDFFLNSNPNYKRTSIDYHVSPLLRNRSNSTSPASPTQNRKAILHKHGIKPIDLGSLRETLEEHDILTLRGQKRELGVLMDKRDALSESISIAQQGYNDEGLTVDDLEMSLKRINSEISSLENVIAASPINSPHVISSPRSNSPTSRKFSQELKMELGQLGSRVAVYTSPRRQSKGNTWQLDHTEAESERDRGMTDRFEKINAMLMRHGPEIEFSSIRLLDRVGSGNSSVVFEGSWSVNKHINNNHSYNYNYNYNYNNYNNNNNNNNTPPLVPKSMPSSFSPVSFSSTPRSTTSTPRSSSPSHSSSSLASSSNSVITNDDGSNTEAEADNTHITENNKHYNTIITLTDDNNNTNHISETRNEGSKQEKEKEREKEPEIVHLRVVVKQMKNVVPHEKLVEEVSRLQRLHHPNMVLVMGACKSPPSIVMEYMGLGNLYDALHIHDVKMDTLLLLKMAKELASVMNHLHNQKTVHGNLWSKCIFICQVDRHKSIRLGGLHLNKEVYGHPNLDGSQQNRNALKWRAPELTRGGKLTDKADVYSYGLILWEMVTNKFPFRQYDDVAAAAKAAYEHLRPKIPGSCPRILRTLIARCWAPNPDDRPSFSEVLKFFNHVEGKLFFIPEKRGIWTLDKEQELEQEQIRNQRFDEIVAFLRKRDIMMQFTEITLNKIVGVGSFAKVWEGQWGEYRVAVKKLRNVNITTTFFLREVHNLQRSHHPNVVVFMGACAQPPCIVTEFMAGGTLHDVLHENHVKLDMWIFLKFARDIAQGMAHLHSLNILHRDLTSKNILLDEYQNVKISDFGLSREVDDKMTLAGICNPRWRPPEITKGQTNYDSKVDVYSFGLVMYEMISGKIPFEKLDSVTAAAKAAYENLRPELSEEIFEPIRALICKCWAQLPEDRPSFQTIVSDIHKIKKQLISEQGLFGNYVNEDSDGSDD